MKLSDRKRKILQYVVDDYISTAQPVSSKSITEKYLKNVSSATVRSELAGLEEMGYLTQLHTSSGRVPSIEAYKLYVAELMNKGKLSAKEIVTIKQAFKDRADNLESVISSAVKVISELTGYTSVAHATHSDKEKIVKIEIFRYKPTQALLLIVTENVLIRDKFIEIPEHMSDEQLKDASKLISKLFTGKKFAEILKFEEEIVKELGLYREIFESVMTAIEEYVEKDASNVVLEGEGKIFNHDTDAEKVKNFLAVVTDKDKLAEMLSRENKDIEISIKIGDSNGKKIPKDCSLVTATYYSSGVEMGTYGVIGPLRMDYQKVVSVLEGVGKILEEIINKK